MRRYALLLIPLFAACEGQVQLDGLPVDCVEFAENGIVHDDLTRAGLLGTLGVPDTLEWSVMRMRGSEDSLFVVRYPGLAVSLHKPAGGTEIVDQVRITDNTHLRYPQSGIGIAADVLKAQFDTVAPLEANGQLIYNCHSHAANDNPVAFQLRADTVVEIIYTYYMD